MNAPATGIVDIRGKAYQTVALRVQMFRDKHPDYALTTDVIERDAECVVMRATIANAEGRTLATGHSEEYRKASQINRTSALENAETSAIGRALAAFGFGGTEFTTANEVANAIHQQAAVGQSSEAHSAHGGATITDEQLVRLQSLIQATNSNVSAFCQRLKTPTLDAMPADRFEDALTLLNDKLARMAKKETDEKAKEAE